MKKSLTIAAAAGLIGAVLVPATASAQQGVIPPVRGSVDPCATVTADFRQSVAAARAAKQSAFRAAAAQFHAATSDERVQIQATGRNGAAKTYRAATADERVQLNNTRQSARSAFKNALKAAHAQHKAGLTACR